MKLKMKKVKNKEPSRELVVYREIPDFEIVGESFRKDTLIWLLRSRGCDPTSRGRCEVVAELVREPHNIKDPNAIAVLIDGYLTGYLSRTDASVQCGRVERLAKLSRVGFAAAICVGSDGHIGVFRSFHR
jgi:hypothetical protein